MKFKALVIVPHRDDIEIKQLVQCRECKHCPYQKECCSDPQNVMEDALALLKEQEAVEPKQVDLHGKDVWYGHVCVCPDCKAEWMSDKGDTHFCPNCGRPVRWNG